MKKLLLLVSCMIMLYSCEDKPTLQKYYVKNTEDIEIISKQIVEENVFIFRAYNLSDINVVWKSVDDELYVYGGDELYATIDVERKGLLVKLSFYWNQEKLNQNMGG